MDQKSMTALVSAFARAWHAANNMETIFDDPLAQQMLTAEEYEGIGMNMSRGIAFFNPAFSGTPEEAIRWIVDNQLSPSPLGRAAFAEQALADAVSAGAEQYVVLAAGYDTFAYRRPAWAEHLRVFEVDRPLMSRDKRSRVEALGGNALSCAAFVEADFTGDLSLRPLEEDTRYRADIVSFFSLLGVSYYLSTGAFEAFLCEIARVSARGSRIAFDYLDEDTFTERAGERTKKQLALAAGASEKMLAGYSREEMKALLSGCGFDVCEDLSPGEITDRFFGRYNRKNPDRPITAFDNVDYCLAERR